MCCNWMIYDATIGSVLRFGPSYLIIFSFALFLPSTARDLHRTNERNQPIATISFTHVRFVRVGFQFHDLLSQVHALQFVSVDLLEQLFVLLGQVSAIEFMPLDVLLELLHARLPSARTRVFPPFVLPDEIDLLFVRFLHLDLELLVFLLGVGEQLLRVERFLSEAFGLLGHLFQALQGEGQVVLQFEILPFERVAALGCFSQFRRGFRQKFVLLLARSRQSLDEIRAGVSLGRRRDASSPPVQR